MSGHSPADNVHTRNIANFVSNLRYEDIPEEVRQRIKLLILDSLGCGLYGTDLPWAKILKETLSAVDSSSDGASLWGTNKRLSAPHAALVNGTQVQGFELDDVHRQGVLHVGAVTLPALIAVTEKAQLSGRDFLTAAVAGYEIGPRVGICMGQEHIGQGWHSGATVGVFSAASGAARALGLSPEQTVHALGIAGTQAAGLMAAQYGAMVKRMHAGRSSQSGLYGALLAQNGFTGIVDVFESPYGGFCTTFSRSQDRFDLNALSAGLGEQFETLRISLKFYSCVGSNHTTLDAIRAIQERRPFTLDELDKIVVYGSQVTADHVGWAYRPEGLTSAQLNLPFCVATLLLEGDVFVDQFLPDCVDSQGRIELSRRVEVLEDPAITAQGSKFRHKVRVEVRLKDGTVETETREAPRGSETYFATEQDIVDKFRKLTRKVMPAEQQDALVEAILRMDELEDARRITDLLRVG
ncbi:MmgE/PrpD family protein [Halomonas salipaludis]|uniref:2-methylcitrate dehydratase n=1 Tax=Halomonas salipaludis TaxID=2032625 RepID=A0A2A2ET83_9GAMM|nr:MmgE/PrpD family protein [Halomonas salipaludis]PAU75572.1 2-methylcitrate dehydratase [Halomonas salipaludis]